MFVRTQWDTQALFSPSSVPVPTPSEFKRVAHIVSRKFTAERDLGNYAHDLVGRFAGMLSKMVAPKLNESSFPRAVPLATEQVVNTAVAVSKQFLRDAGPNKISTGCIPLSLDTGGGVRF